MRRLQLALACIACSVATSSMAGATYSFGTGASPTGGATNFSGSGSYGNSLTYSATSGTGPSVIVSAWGSVGTGGNLQKAYLNNNYSTNNKTELAITSQGSSGGSGYGELTSGGNPQPDSSHNEHAIDNDGGYESLLLSFTTAVTLNSISLGFPSGSNPDSDMTVLEYVGGAANPATTNLANYTYASLLTNGWALVSQSALYDVATQPNGTANITPSTTSKYWMVGAYMAIGGNAANQNYDFVKVNGFTATTPGTVPEPGSIALLGIAGVALLASRRRRGN